MIVLSRTDVLALLDGREQEVVDAVRRAYVAHSSGDTAVPHSVFLRFPDDPANRIIGLPAHLGGPRPTTGIKWIASFPANTAVGLERAAAAMILNCVRTGRPLAVLEASVISARRTAASAALAAHLLAADTDRAGVTLLGCGVINFEILRFLRHVKPDLAEVAVYDRDPDRATGFGARCAAELPQLRVSVEASASAALARHTLVSVATTATSPYLDIDAFAPGTLVLHVSLRDVLPDAVLDAVNIVDDADHVCREATSLHLAEQRVGHRDFIATTIGERVMRGGPSGREPTRVTLFSPFGLGVLDLAVGELVLRRARHGGRGTRIENFLGDDHA